MFVDLSKGAAPVAMPERSTSSPIRTPRTRHIDLSNGAPLPPDEEDDASPVMAPEPNIVTITADRVADPYEEANRGRFRNHVRLHRYVIDPVERAYMFVVPVPARAG
ncbi:MAG TPA: MlaA family lipoprotein, partial [Burkholderiales bacterium]|nr:MlaA family lipoprotein [Burkholderiales bacterium]